MIYRLKKNFEFSIVYRRGKSFANDFLVMYILKNKRNKDKKFNIYNILLIIGLNTTYITVASIVLITAFVRVAAAAIVAIIFAASAGTLSK